MLYEKPILPPPWIAYPHIERYSIGWRMGYGEDYIFRWGEWYDALGEAEQKEYQRLFPEPVIWQGYWTDEDSGDVFHRGEFVLALWRENGTPKYSLDWLKAAVSVGEKPEYEFFWGHQPSEDGIITKSCLSQWWKSEFWSVAHTYCCMEQFMMAAKAELFSDEEIREQILACGDPRTIKALGRKVRNFDGNLWDKVKYAIVLNGNFCKFSQKPALRAFLLSTGDRILVEASPYDRVWGIGMGQSNEKAKDPFAWRGQNLLGFALMEVRDELRRVWENADLCKDAMPKF